LPGRVPAERREIWHGRIVPNLGHGHDREANASPVIDARGGQEREDASDTESAKREGSMTRRGTIRIALVLAAIASLALVSARAQTRAARASTQAAAAPSCQLNSARGDIKHVIYIQFDNTHFRRDNANVPSDLEQMPHLLNFMRDNGTLMTNDHTVLISHTATGILSSLTGVYPDRLGQPVSTSYRDY